MSPLPVQVTVPQVRDAMRAALSDGPRPLDALVRSVRSSLWPPAGAAHARAIEPGALEELVVYLLEEAEPRLLVTDDDLVIDAERFVRGITFTHRVTEQEAADGVLVVGVDLVLIGGLAIELAGGAPPILALVDGTELRWSQDASDGIDDEAAADADDFELHGQATVTGPAGWLEGRAGTLLGCRLDGDRWIAEFAPPSPDPALTGAIRGALRAWAPHPSTSLLDLDVVYDWCCALPATTTVLPSGVLPPISELLDAEALRHRGTRVGAAGVDWQADTQRRMHLALAEMWDVDLTAVEAHGLLIGARLVHVALAEHGEAFELTDADLADFHAALAKPKVAELLADHHDDLRLDETEASLAAFLRDLRAGAPDNVAARIDWILSTLADEPAERERLLQSSARRDRRFAAVHDDRLLGAWCRDDRVAMSDSAQAWFVAVRPLAAGAARESGAVPDGSDSVLPRAGLRMALGRSRATPVRRPQEVGRNEPCPCGSGRKYKVCHAGRTDDAAIEAAADLTQRLCNLAMLVHDRRRPADLEGIYALLAHHHGGEKAHLLSMVVLDAEVARRNETDRIVALTEGFGRAWTDAERDALADALGAPLSLFVVEDRAGGVSMTLRDLRTGARCVVYGTDTSRGFSIDDYVLARVVGPTNRKVFSQGALLVPFTDRDTTLAWLDGNAGAPHWEELVHWMNGGGPGRAGWSAAGGPRIRNTSGDALVLHHARLAFDVAPDDAVQRLSALDGAMLEEPAGTGEAADVGDATGTRIAIARDLPREGTRIASLTVHASPDEEAGCLVDIEVNSDERYAQLIAEVSGVLGAARELVHAHETMEEAQLAVEFGLRERPSEPADPLGGFRPEELSEVAREMEQRWLREQIPALGGATPREAAADPTRRKDLIALLRSFRGAPAGPLSLDPQRLADELGVDLR